MRDGAEQGNKDCWMHFCSPVLDEVLVVGSGKGRYMGMVKQEEKQDRR